ncbi:hypothetical protein PR202_ga20797 [Eleusine coracana subsp. coracana]|uniref:Uncharacterized protein n=1 Tax=Eleusine coracana subsp. coracana TaxID=191504 RepID=A0AAV5CZD7_ELECO|nr:hypothetical protein QOZ80_8AG0628360 [Eleusine coracana subsp. coracana]GJN03360.1 hypothetical protein PR202_ga20797 [Eleusine coracana subsp. coracana]
MQVEKGSLDLVLVPCGLVIMFGYHLLLLYRILRHPGTTVIGYENHNKLAWVRRMVQASPDETGLALSVISSNISASTTLASLSIALGSLIGAWVSSTTKVFMTELVYGDRSQATATVKYISLLVCFLASFTCFIHSARYYVQASFLITTLDSDVPASYVQHAVIRGGNFWSMGLRALYFATTLLMWIFGPIQMFACSVLMVIILHMLDSNSLPLHQHQFTVRKRHEQRVLTPTLVARQPSPQNPIFSNPILSPVTFFN